MPYDHTITITRPGAYTTTDAAGNPTDRTTTGVASAARCDVQDMSDRTRRTVYGDAMPEGGAEVFFPEAKFPSTVEVDDDVSATYGQKGVPSAVTRTGKVFDVDRLTPAITLKWTSPN